MSSSFAAAYPTVNRAATPKQLASKSLRIVSSRLDLWQNAQRPITGQSALQRLSHGMVSTACHNQAKRATLAGIRLASDKLAGAPVPQRSCSRNQRENIPIES